MKPRPLKRVNKYTENKVLHNFKTIRGLAYNTSKINKGIVHSEETHKELIKLHLEIQELIFKVIWN